MQARPSSAQLSGGAPTHGHEWGSRAREYTASHPEQVTPQLCASSCPSTPEPGVVLATAVTFFVEGSLAGKWAGQLMVVL